MGRCSACSVTMTNVNPSSSVIYIGFPLLTNQAFDFLMGELISIWCLANLIKKDTMKDGTQYSEKGREKGDWVLSKLRNQHWWAVQNWCYFIFCLLFRFYPTFLELNCLNYVLGPVQVLRHRDEEGCSCFRGFLNRLVLGHKCVNVLSEDTGRSGHFQPLLLSSLGWLCYSRDRSNFLKMSNLTQQEVSPWP